jgi:hypothetical protein
MEDIVPIQVNILKHQELMEQLDLPHMVVKEHLDYLEVAQPMARLLQGKLQEVQPMGNHLEIKYHTHKEHQELVSPMLKEHLLVHQDLDCSEPVDYLHLD